MNDLDPRLEPWLSAMRRSPAASPEALTRLHVALRDEDVRAALRIFSPAAAVAAAITLIVLTSSFWVAFGRIGGWSTAQQRIEDGEFATALFVLHAGAARSVTIVGDFNDWDPDATPLTDTGDGAWSVVLRVRPGMVRYSFLVDGTEWRADPRGVPARSDFGRPTSVAFFSQTGAL
jgi:hypothetical protein